MKTTLGRLWMVLPCTLLLLDDLAVRAEWEHPKLLEAQAGFLPLPTRLDLEPLRPLTKDLLLHPPSHPHLHLDEARLLILTNQGLDPLSSEDEIPPIGKMVRSTSRALRVCSPVPDPLRYP